MGSALTRSVRWPTPRALLLGFGIAVAAAVSLAAALPLGQATSGGSAYTVPRVVDTNPNPRIVETTLTAREQNVNIGQGVTAKALTYNGSIPGPTFRLKVGDTVIVRLNNRLTHETGIHWHGIELPSGMDGTPFTQNEVAPGKSYLYKFTVHRPGIFWYHPHFHSSTNQVYKGLYGMIIVKDPNENQLVANGTLPPASQTKPVVLSDMTVCRAPGNNSDHTYNDNDDFVPGLTAPWAGSATANALPHQPSPTPKELCEGGFGPYPINEDGATRAPFAAGEIPNTQTILASRVNEGQTVLTNGRQVGPRGGGPAAEGYTQSPTLGPGVEAMNVRPGQGLRLQFLNASTTRYMRLHLTAPDATQVPLRRIGGEGGLLDNARTEGGTQGSWITKYTAGEILLPPGTRADVVAAIPALPSSGVMTLWTRDYSRTGLTFSNTATVPVMHLNLSGSPVSPAFTMPDGKPLRAATGNTVETLGAATGALLNPAGFPPAKPGTSNQNIALTAGGNQVGINGTTGIHDFLGDYKDVPHIASSRYAVQGETLQLTVQNTTSAHHPFHLHGFSIQPIELNGPGAGDDFVFPYREFVDNIDVPAGYTLTYRVRLDPRAMPDNRTGGGARGRWIFHCHIFFHATHGMISELVVTNPQGNEKPEIELAKSFIRVPRGRIAVVTGNFKDPDGDSVALRASEGRVVKTGGGNFRWRLRRPRGTNRIIYINATDSNGLKAQIPVNMNKFPEIRRMRVRPSSFSNKARIRFILSEPGRVRFVARRVGGGKTVRFTRRFARGGRKRVLLRARRFSSGNYVLKARAIDRTGLRSALAKSRFLVS